jgi:hypothetical protein
MSLVLPGPTRRQGRRRRRGAAGRRWGARLIVAGAIFALGIALGEALHDNPAPGRTSTSVRTLRPGLPVTVTVTVRR